MKKITHYLKLLSVLCLMMAAKPLAAQGSCSITSMYVQYGNAGAVYINVNTIGSGSLSPNNYYWDYGNGTTQSGSNLFYVSETYTANGNYTVTLVYTDSLLACTSTATVNVNVTSAPCGLNTAFSILQSSTGVTYFTASGGVLPGVSYAWSFGDPGNSSFFGNSTVASTASFSYPNNTTYYATLLVLDSLNATSTCSAAASSAITITNVVNPASCAVNASFTYTVGTNGNVNFINTSSSTPGTTSYTWSYGDGTSDNYVTSSYSPLHTFTANGTYMVLLKGYDYNSSTGLSCFGASTVYITITNAVCALNPAFNLYESNNGLVNFYNSTTGFSGSTTYTWNFGDGNSSSSFSPYHSYAANGTYTVTLNASDTSYMPVCAASISTVVTVANVGSPCTLNSDFSSSQGGNGYVSFSNTSSGTSGLTSYAWTFGDGSTSSSSNPGHNYLNGVYSVTLVASDASYSPPCVSVKIETLSVTTNTNCVANAGFSVSPSGTPQIWDAFPLFPANVSAAKWSWGDGSYTDSLYVSHTYASAGTYFICLSVTITCGASDSSCMNYAIYRTMHAMQNMNMIQVNVINPNAPLGIKNTSLDNATFQVSPNPNNGSFHMNISGLDAGTSLVSIYNVMGELVYKTEQEILNGSLVKDIQLNQAANGVYFIKITSKGQTLTKKMVVTTN